MMVPTEAKKNMRRMRNQRPKGSGSMLGPKWRKAKKEEVASTSREVDLAE